MQILPRTTHSTPLLTRDTLLGVAILSLSLLCATSSWASALSNPSVGTAGIPARDTQAAGVHGPWRLVVAPAKEKVEIKADTLALKRDSSATSTDSLPSTPDSTASDSAARVGSSTRSKDTLQLSADSAATERLWEDSFGTRYLERLYDSAGTLWSRVELDPAAATLDDSAAASNDPDSLENRALNRSRGGRVPLIVYSTLLGLAVDGPLLLMTTEPTSSRGAVGTYMLGAAAGIGLPLILTDEAATSQAQALLYWHGSTRMSVYGLLLSGSIDENASGEARAGTILGSSIAGGVGGWYLGKGVSLGRAEHIAAWSDASLAAGFLLVPVRFGFSHLNPAKFAQIAIPVHAAGLTFATLSSDNDDFTRGDAYASRAFGWVGLLTVPGLIIAADLKAAEDNRGTLGAMALATLGGQYVGDRLVRDRHLTTAQGALVDASTLAGLLVGMGTGYLLTEDVQAVATFGLLGTYGGLVGSWMMLDKVGKSGGSTTAGDFRLQLNPLALQAGLAGKAGAAGTQVTESRGPRDAMPGAAQPFATVAWNW